MLKKNFVVILGCVAFAIPLLGFVYNGSFMRYNGDDYCYAASLGQYGFLKRSGIPICMICPIMATVSR